MEAEVAKQQPANPEFTKVKGQSIQPSRVNEAIEWKHDEENKVTGKCQAWRVCDLIHQAIIVEIEKKKHGNVGIRKEKVCLIWESTDWIKRKKAINLVIALKTQQQRFVTITTNEEPYPIAIDIKKEEAGNNWGIWKEGEIDLSSKPSIITESVLRLRIDPISTQLAKKIKDWQLKGLKGDKIALKTIWFQQDVSRQVFILNIKLKKKDCSKWVRNESSST